MAGIGALLSKGVSAGVSAASKAAGKAASAAKNAVGKTGEKAPLLGRDRAEMSDSKAWHSMPDPAGIGSGLKLGQPLSRADKAKKLAAISARRGKRFASSTFSMAKNKALNPGATFKSSWQGVKNMGGQIQNGWNGMSKTEKVVTGVGAGVTVGATALPLML